LAVVIMVLSGLLVAAEEPTSLTRLDDGLGKAWKELAATLPRDTDVTVAAIDFVDDLGGITRLGGISAKYLGFHIAKTPNVRLAERGGVQSIMKEKEFWLADFVEDGDPQRRAEAAKLLRADYLAVGELAPVGKSINFVVRLVKVGPGETVRMTKFSIPRDPTAPELLWYVQRPTKKLTRPIELPPIELSYKVLAQRRRANGFVEEIRVRDGTVLHSRDQFQIRFTPVSDCWVYVFLFDSTGKSETLFPYPGIKLGNFCRGGVSYTVPDPAPPIASRWFYLDENPGTETLYIVASYEPMSDLDSIVAHMNAAAVSQQGKPSRDLAGAIDEIRRRAGDPKNIPEGITLVDSARLAAEPDRSPDTVSEVLRGTFAVVKELRFEHR